MNPKWIAFLKTKGMSPAQADALDRQSRISLNAEFMGWNMRRADARHAPVEGDFWDPRNTEIYAAPAR